MEWAGYLSDRRVTTDPRKRFGARVELVPTEGFRSVMLGGEPVVPRSEVERLIREHPALYANAKELLSD